MIMEAFAEHKPPVESRIATPKPRESSFTEMLHHATGIVTTSNQPVSPDFPANR